MLDNCLNGHCLQNKTLRPDSKLVFSVGMNNTNWGVSQQKPPDWGVAGSQPVADGGRWGDAGGSGTHRDWGGASEPYGRTQQLDKATKSSVFPLKLSKGRETWIHTPGHSSNKGMKNKEGMSKSYWISFWGTTVSFFSTFPMPAKNEQFQNKHQHNWLDPSQCPAFLSK